jgi:uncharacterized membrane protein
VNSVLGGALVTLVLTIGLGLRTLPATLIGIAVGVVVLLATLRYERRRIRSVTSGSAGASSSR